jgi:lipopolysaccharide transport system ATP-binding protein
MAVIDFEHVTKTYRLGSRVSLRETLVNGLAHLVPGHERDDQHINALDDVSFQVNNGEVLGLIGPNGAGKTTALKILSRVTYPTSGSVSVDGRVSALIELGAGFHPDLTGTENIYLNASILGLRQPEIAERFDQIVEFSGLKDFLDTPIKRYSSGMYARLAFSVAAHVDPDVLLVDEVLAVGDLLFQEKCFRRMKRIRDSGKAMVFVSHNLIAVQNICTRVIWLDHGHIRADGNPEEVISQYLHGEYHQSTDPLELAQDESLSSFADHDIELRDTVVLDAQGDQFDTIAGGQSVVLRVRLEARCELTDLNVKAYLTDRRQSRLMGSDWHESVGQELTVRKGESVISCAFRSTPRRPDVYYFGLEISQDRTIILRTSDIGPVIVRPDTSAQRFEEYNLFAVDTAWEFEATGT